MAGAAQSGGPYVVKLLKEWGAEVTLIAAAALGDLDRVCHFLSQGADVNARDRNGRTALMGAARGGHSEVAQVF